ncbi:MAG TPA: hypothetical protein VFZ95_09810, partial [Steroidobacteraceae bacterium]
YWYRTGEARLMACTLGKGARDNCTLSVNEFVRMGGEWSPGFSDGVMCNVTDVNRVRSPPPSRFASRRL